MWLIGCEFRGEPHWLGYSAWNATLYEPALDRLLMLDREDFAEEGRIDEALAKLEIRALVCYGQLWSKVASVGRKKRRRGGGRGGGQTASPRRLKIVFQYSNGGLAAFYIMRILKTGVNRFRSIYFFDFEKVKRYRHP